MNIIEGNKNEKNLNFAIVQSRFNEEIGKRLLSGALSCLKENGYNDDKIPIIKVPGAFEIPFAAEKLATQKKYDAIICLGAVIKGERSGEKENNKGWEAATVAIEMASLVKKIRI